MISTFHLRTVRSKFSVLPTFLISCMFSLQVLQSGFPQCNAVCANLYDDSDLTCSDAVASNVCTRQSACKSVVAVNSASELTGSGKVTCDTEAATADWSFTGLYCYSNLFLFWYYTTISYFHQERRIPKIKNMCIVLSTFYLWSKKVRKGTCRNYECLRTQTHCRTTPTNTHFRIVSTYHRRFTDMVMCVVDSTDSCKNFKTEMCQRNFDGCGFGEISVCGYAMHTVSYHLMESKTFVLSIRASRTSPLQMKSPASVPRTISCCLSTNIITPPCVHHTHMCNNLPLMKFAYVYIHIGSLDTKIIMRWSGWHHSLWKRHRMCSSNC